MSEKAPNSRRNLDRAIERAFGRENYMRVRTAMANAVAAQIMAANGEIDFAKTRETCIRLFAYRKLHIWPPKVEPAEEWKAVYEEERIGTPALETLDEAVAWANILIERIYAAE